MHDTYEINDIADLAPLRAVWNDLLGRTPGATFFQTLEWLEVYWRHFGGDRKLRVVIAGDPQAPLGILPLVVHREQRGVGKIRVLTYPMDDWGSYYGPIGPRPADTLRAGLSHVRRTRKCWDLLDLRFVPEETRDAATTRDIMCEVELTPRPSVREETSVFELSGTWDEFLAKQSSKWRNNFKRWQKRLNQAGTVVYERYRPAAAEHGESDPRWDLYDECERVASISWQGASQDGTTLSSAEVRDYLRDTHVAAARSGCLDLNLLRVDDRCVAFAYNYVFGGTLHGLRIGYDPELSQASPGNLMYARVIRDSLERGDSLYDLGPGSLDIKRYWRSRLEPVMQYTYYQPLSIRSQLLKWKGRINDHMDKRLLQKGLLDKRLATVQQKDGDKPCVAN